MVINKRGSEEEGEREVTQGREGPREVGRGKRQMDVSPLGGKAHTLWCLFLLRASSTPLAPQPKDPLDCCHCVVLSIPKPTWVSF